MENIIDFPNRETIETEACAWVTKLDAHDAISHADRAALQEWISRSPVHQQELHRVANLWGDLNRLTDLLPGLNQLPAAQPPSKVARWAPFKNPMPYLASISLVLVALVITVNLYPGDPNHRAYTTAIGEQRSIDLPDGSVMQLNTDSQVQVDFDSATRSIQLIKGQAHFQVAHNKARPFEVEARAGLIRALGTAFTVYLQDKKVEVTVTQGLVEVAATQPTANLLMASADSDAGAGADSQAIEKAKANATDNTVDKTPAPLFPASTQASRQASRQVSTKTITQVSANQNLTYNGSLDQVQSLEQSELTKKLSWRQGMLLFSGESLEQVVSEVSRYTTQSIVIVDPTIRDIRIAGYFKADDTRALFDALSLSFGVQVSRINKNLVHLSRE